MKKLKKIKRKYKLPVAFLIFILGVVSLVFPPVPGWLLISFAVVLVKDYYKPLDMAVDATVGVVEDIGDEVIEMRKKGWKKYIEGAKRRYKKFKNNWEKKKEKKEVKSDKKVKDSSRVIKKEEKIKKVSRQ